jgi:hypothetical protein
VTGYRLDDWGSGFRFPVGTRNFSLLQRIYAGSGAHPATYSMVPGLSDRGVRLTTHILLVQRSRMRGAIPPPQYIYVAWCLVKHKDNFIRTWSAYLRGRDRLGDLSVDGRITLKWILEKRNVKLLNGFNWLRRGSTVITVIRFHVPLKQWFFYRCKKYKENCVLWN